MDCLGETMAGKHALSWKNGRRATVLSGTAKALGPKLLAVTLKLKAAGDSKGLGLKKLLCESITEFRFGENSSCTSLSNLT